MRPLYMVHHAIVIVVYGAGVLREKAHYWGALSALCETTNIFCTIIEIFACWCTTPSSLLSSQPFIPSFLQSAPLSLRPSVRPFVHPSAL